MRLCCLGELGTDGRLDAAEIRGNKKPGAIARPGFVNFLGCGAILEIFHLLITPYLRSL